MENETTFTKFGNSFQSKVIALLLTNKSFLQTISDLYFLRLFSGSSSAAALAILFKVIYTPITMAMAIPGTYLEPILYQKVDSKNIKDKKIISIFKFSKIFGINF